MLLTINDNNLENFIIQNLKNLDNKYIDNLHIICNEKIVNKYLKMYMLDENIYVNKIDIMKLRYFLTKTKYQNNLLTNFNLQYDFNSQLYDFKNIFIQNKTLTIFFLKIIIFILLDITTKYISYGKNYMNII